MTIRRAYGFSPEEAFSFQTVISTMATLPKFSRNTPPPVAYAERRDHAAFHDPGELVENHQQAAGQLARRPDPDRPQVPGNAFANVRKVFGRLAANAIGCTVSHNLPPPQFSTPNLFGLHMKGCHNRPRIGISGRTGALLTRHSTSQTHETDILVLAAGMGSRYGGLKQMDPMGPNGETVLDYSVFDAIRAGFGRVVFIIREDFAEAFRQGVGARFADRIQVDYAFQKLDDLPDGFSVPEGRAKPWGTAHAVRAARACREGATSP